MKTLLLIVFLSNVGCAEQYIFNLRPNGPGCGHVEIKRQDGSLVKVTTLDEISDPKRLEEDLLLSQIKEIIEITGARSDSAIKSALESTDFKDARVKR